MLARDSGGAASPESAQFIAGLLRVQLDSMEEYAKNLQVTIERLENGLSKLSGEPRFGDLTSFGEARGLHDRYREALRLMKDLYSQISGGTQTAQTAAREIAESYRSTDEFHAATLRDIEQALGAEIDGVR